MDEQDNAGVNDSVQPVPDQPQPNSPSVALATWPDLDVLTIDLDVLWRLVRAADPRGVDEEEALGGVAAIGRLTRFLAARELRLLARACRTVSEPTDTEKVGGPEFGDLDLTVAEVAPMLSLSKAEAARKVGTASSLVEDLPMLVALMEAGRVGLGHVEAAESQLREVISPDDPVWDAVQDHLAYTLPGRTRRQVGADTRRAIDRADPSAAARRAAKAKRARRVEAYALPEGMGCVSATLTATTTRLVDTVLDALADGCRNQSAAAGSPDARTHQQRRADAFGAVFTAIAYGTPLPVVADSTEVGSEMAAGRDGNSEAHDNRNPHRNDGWRVSDETRFGGNTEPADAHPALDVFTHGVLGWWCPPALPAQQGRRPHLTVIVAESTLNGEDDNPAELSGYGPVPAGLAREIADEAGITNRIVLPDGDNPTDAAARSRATGETAPRRTGRGRPPVRPQKRVRQPNRTWTFIGHGPGDEDACTRRGRPYRGEQTLTDAVVALHQTCRHPGCRGSPSAATAITYTPTTRVAPPASVTSCRCAVFITG